ncbi:hypothetical protein ALP36_102989 [Pseudomonas syringae pv. coriandricola]|uniref:Uncharacterized protein n=1 Tax=Pseudomonas syringae pv. coriandricola TaxID=264453 RepID=A0A3M5RQ33_9PSED|nr:hypothetical protein ALP36_102989 [Pseudomonas syringae pv. coriandricola]
MGRKQTSLTSQNRCVTHHVTDLRRTLKIRRRASRTACDAERRTIVEITMRGLNTDNNQTRSLKYFASASAPSSTVELVPAQLQASIRLRGSSKSSTVKPFRSRPLSS